jgi:leucyl aminopeptidase
MKLSVKTANPSRDRAACLIALVFEDAILSPSAAVIDAAAGGALSSVVRRGDIRGRSGQSLLLQKLPGMQAERLLLVGAGKAPEFNLTALRKAIAQAVKELGRYSVGDAIFYLESPEDADPGVEDMARHAAEAAQDATYRFDRLKSKSDKNDAPLKRLALAVNRTAATAARRGLGRGEAIAAGVALARELGNLPANVCTPTHLAEQARTLQREVGLKVTVYDEKQIQRLRMTSFLSVSRGSRQPPRLIVLEHRGGPRGSAPVALVGKGITFDTGGISLKPADKMDEMKFDMCGAAAVIGTMKSIALMNLPVNVVAIVPACENMPDGQASRPGDVVTSMSGQTIEILNTDAEGRLILCDALTFSERFRPEVTIDTATLTGAIVVALGSHAHGLFTPDDSLAEALLAAGNRSQDRAWRMPLWEDYQGQLDSNFADMANVGGRSAGAVTAACFLWRFARARSWAHLDIAGTAWNSGKDKGGTGRPVPLLTQYLLDRADAPAPRRAGGRRRRS